MSSANSQNQNELSNQSSQHNVCLCPAVDSAAVGAGKFLSLHFCGRPAFLFNRTTSISELRGGRTTHEQAFQIGAGTRFRSPSRRFEIKAPCHLVFSDRGVNSHNRKRINCSVSNVLWKKGNFNH